MAKINAETILNYIYSENDIVSPLLTAKAIKLSSDNFFKINQTCDTVIVMIEKFFQDDFNVSFFSHNDSAFVSKYRNEIKLASNQDREQIRRYYALLNSYEPTVDSIGKINHDYALMISELRPDFYEKELLLDWDTDSLDILSSYDTSFRESYSRRSSYRPNCQAYRFIIKDGEFTVDSHYYKGYPLPPDKYAPAKELLRRKKIREKLRIISIDDYEKLYEKKKE